MNTKAVLYALLAFAIFSTHDVVVKYLSVSLSAFQIVFFSSLLSFPLLTLMMVQDKTLDGLRPKYPGWTILRSLIIPIIPTGAFYAFSVLPLAQAYALFFAAPLLITLLSIPVLKERVGLHRLLAVAVGFLGVVVVLRPGATELSWGHAAALLAAFGNATQSVILRKVGSAEKPVVLMLYPLLATVLVMALALPFTYQPLQGSELGQLALVALLGFFATLLVVKAYALGEATTVAPMQYSQIIWASAFGSLLFGEALDVATLMGASIVIASGVFIVMREARGGKSENRPVLQTRSRAVSSFGANVSVFLRQRGSRNTED